MKTIAVYAGCRNDEGNGDFSYAALLSLNLIEESEEQGLPYHIVLVCMAKNLSRFTKIFESRAGGKGIKVGNRVIELCSMEDFDTHKFKVVAFVEANRCAYPPAEVLKKIISTDSKFLFVGNVHRTNKAPEIFLKDIKVVQPDLYDYFSPEDIYNGNAGFGESRLGLTSLPTAESLLISDRDKISMPKGPYNFMYVANTGTTSDYKLMKQYINITTTLNSDPFLLVGYFSSRADKIQAYIEKDIKISGYPKFSYPVMRRVGANANLFVLTTGDYSTIEVMDEGKLPLYQNVTHEVFIQSYLLALRTLSSRDAVNGNIIFQLAAILFAPKPLAETKVATIKQLLTEKSITNGLVTMNQEIIGSAKGRIAKHLLSFIGKPAESKKEQQAVMVCNKLKRENESSLSCNQALIRAVLKGYSFELKILISVLTVEELNTKDRLGWTALHWAVFMGDEVSVGLLRGAGASIDIANNLGRTCLDFARQNGNASLIKLLGGQVNSCVLL